MNLTFVTGTSVTMDKGYVFTLGIPFGGYIKSSYALYIPLWLGIMYQKSEYVLYCIGAHTINGGGEFQDYLILHKMPATVFYIK